MPPAPSPGTVSFFFFFFEAEKKTKMYCSTGKRNAKGQHILSIYMWEILISYPDLTLSLEM